MKKLINIRLFDTLPFKGWIVLGILVLIGFQPAEAKTNNIGVSFQVFYDGLAPYGDWVQDPNYGYIWIPYAEPGFQPYRTNGYWVNSRFGNTWVSQYEWGWAPFHYGRWFYDNFYGWAWVPGYEWGPAWVEWRTGGGYYGWAPLMPRVGVHVAVAFPVNYWVFVPRRRLLARNIYSYYIPPRNVTVIYNQTTIVNNTYVYNNRTYVAGPSHTELQRVTRSRVPVYEVTDGGRPGRASVENNSVRVYRPEISEASARNSSNVRPSRTLTADEFKANRREGDRTTATGTRPTTPENRRSAAVPEVTSPRSSAANARSERNSVQQPSAASARSAAPANIQRGAVRAEGENRTNAVRQTPRTTSQPQTRSTAPSSGVNTRTTAPPRQSNANVTSRPENSSQRGANVQQARPQTPRSQVRQAPAQRQSSPSVNSNRSSTVNRQQARPQQRVTSAPSNSSRQSSVSRSAPSRSQSAPRVAPSSSQRSSGGTASSGSRTSGSSSRRGN